MVQRLSLDLHTCAANQPSIKIDETTIRQRIIKSIFSIFYEYEKVIFEDMNYLLTFSANVGITWDLDTVFYN